MGCGGSRIGPQPASSSRAYYAPPPQVKAKKSGAGHRMYKVCRRGCTGCTRCTPVVAEDTYGLFLTAKGELRGEGEVNAQGEREGQGTMVYASGDMYEGQWLAGEKQGRGKLNNATGNVYEGEWAKDERHGHGTDTYANGDLYDGQYVKDEKQGCGKYGYSSGDVYDGEWAGGEQHGIATFTYADGSVMVGCFEADAVVGQGVHWSMDRMTALELQAGAAVRGIPLDEAAKITERIGLPPPWEAEHSTVIERYDLRLRDLYGVVTM